MFPVCVETDTTQCSNIDVIHSVIGETNLCKKLPGPTYIEVHITNAYPMIVSHKAGHIYVDFRVQLWNASYLAQHNFPHDVAGESDHSAFFDF